MQFTKQRCARNAAYRGPIVFAMLCLLPWAEFGCRHESTKAPAAGLKDVAAQGAGDHAVDAPPQVDQEAQGAREQANRDAATPLSRRNAQGARSLGTR